MNKKPVTLPDKNPMSDAAWDFMTKQWFEGVITPPPDRLLAVFLMNIYRNAQAGHPLSKKEAWRHVGIEDVKTGRKYLARAFELGLISVVRSESDRRKELLYPTETLATAVSFEVAVLESSINRYVSMSRRHEEDKAKEAELPLLQKVLRAHEEAGIYVKGVKSDILREIWNKFLSGDPNAFEDNFYDDEGRRTRAELIFRYGRQLDFRRRVDRFIQVYEQLLEKVSESEDARSLRQHLAAVSGTNYTIALDISSNLGTPRSWARHQIAKAAASGEAS